MDLIDIGEDLLCLANGIGQNMITPTYTKTNERRVFADKGSIVVARTCPVRYRGKIIKNSFKARAIYEVPEGQETSWTDLGISTSGNITFGHIA